MSLEIPNSISLYKQPYSYSDGAFFTPKKYNVKFVLKL